MQGFSAVGVFVEARRVLGSKPKHKHDVIRVYESRTVARDDQKQRKRKTCNMGFRERFS